MIQATVFLGSVFFSKEKSRHGLNKVGCVFSTALVWLFFLLLPVSSLFAQLPDSLAQVFTRLIEKEMKANRIMGISVAIVDDQQMVWAEGFGYANREKKEKAGPNTIYRVASVSKLFTSTSIMQLHQQGKLNINQEVKELIPEFAIRSRIPNQGPITIRSLMTHHSGIPSDLLGCLFMDNPPSFREIVPYLNEEYTIAPVNHCMAYSNAALTLLGVVVERASGRDFLDYTQQQLFQPMEMNHSSFGMEIEKDSLFATGYVSGKKAFGEPPLFEVPAGMMHSTVVDLSRFMQMVFAGGSYKGNQILAPALIDSMLTIQNRKVQRDQSGTIGLSWFVRKEGSAWDYAGGMAEHGGDTHVFHAQLSTLPKQKLGIVILTNSRNGAGPIRQISDSLLVKYLQVVKGLEPPKVEPEPEKISFPKVHEFVPETHTGIYTLGPDPVFFQIHRKKLAFSQGGVTILLKPNNRNTLTPAISVLGLFSIPMKKQELFFSEIEGVDHLFAISNGDTMTIGHRVPMPEYAEPWLSRVGKYVPEENRSGFRLVSDIRIQKDDHWLKMKIKGDLGSMGRVGMVPIDENTAIVPGCGRNTGYSIRFFPDGSFSLAGLKMKKIK